MDGLYDLKSDMYTLGDGLVFAPLTEVVATGNRLVRIESVAPDGSSMTFREAPLEEKGRLKIKFDDKRIDAHLVVVSEDGKTSFVDQGKEKSTNLPAGTYRMVYGLVFSKRENRIAAIMLPNKMQPFVVEAGKTTKVTLGRDIALVFDAQRNGESIAINPYRTTIEGKDGERYYGYDVVGTPQVGLQIVKGRKKKLYPMGGFKLC